MTLHAGRSVEREISAVVKMSESSRCKFCNSKVVSVIGECSKSCG